MKTILYIAPSITVKGGISSVLRGYLNTTLSDKYRILLISSHKDGNKIFKFFVAVIGLINTLLYLIFNKVDIVHIHGSDYISSLRKYIFFKCVKFFNCKIIFHHHAGHIIENFSKLPLFLKKRIQFLYEKSDLVICLSESWKKALLKIAPCANILVLKNSVAIPKLHHTNYSDQSEIKFLFLGAIEEKKGIFDLIKVVKQITNMGYKIILNVGGVGENKKIIQAVSDLELQDIVKYHGWLDSNEKEIFFNISDVYILPSYGEGMPMSILEAMSYGLPVISTNVGGIPELVVDNETGFLIQPGDLDAMSERIERLIKDEELRTRMGLNARKTIENSYNLDLNIIKLDETYQALLNT